MSILDNETIDMLKRISAELEESPAIDELLRRELDRRTKKVEKLKAQLDSIEPPHSQPPKWEYAVVRFTGVSNEDIPSFNRFGDLGWELVSIVGEKERAYFKRPL